MQRTAGFPCKAVSEGRGLRHPPRTEAVAQTSREHGASISRGTTLIHHGDNGELLGTSPQVRPRLGPFSHRSRRNPFWPLWRNSVDELRASIAAGSASAGVPHPWNGSSVVLPIEFMRRSTEPVAD